MNNKQTKVMVAGGTGYIGGGVLQALHKKGFWIRALARDANRLRNRDWCDDVFVGHATQKDTIRNLCDGIDTIFSSIGIHSFGRKPTVWEVDYQANMNIVEEALRAGVKHAVFITVVQCTPMAKVSPIAEARGKVAQAIIDSGMDYNIFEPAGFFNDMAMFIKSIQKSGKAHVFGDGSGHINPLCSLDLADEIARTIENPALRNTVRPIGGCETFTHKQVAELAFQIVGKEPKIRPVAPWKLALIAGLLRPFNYNVYSLVKFFEFFARTSDMTGENIGHRRLEDYFKNIAAGQSNSDAEANL